MRFFTTLMLPAMAYSLVCPSGMYSVPAPIAAKSPNTEICFLLNPIIRSPSRVERRTGMEGPRKVEQRAVTPSVRTTSRPLNPTVNPSSTRTTSTVSTSITSTSSTTSTTSRTTTVQSSSSSTSRTSTTLTTSTTSSTTVSTSTTAATSTTTTTTTTSTTPSTTGSSTTASSTSTTTPTSSTTTSVTVSPTIITLTSTTTPTTTSISTSVSTPSSSTTTSTTTTTTVTPTPISTTSTTSTTTTTSRTTTTSGLSCPTHTGAYVLRASGTGDVAIDGNFAQLQSAFGSGYRVSLSANRANAQQFRLAGDCKSLITSDGNLLAMIGGTANLHNVYFFPSVQAASALINVNWEALECAINADNTLTCTGMNQFIFQVTQGEQILQIGDQNYGEIVTINLTPVPGSVF